MIIKDILEHLGRLCLFYLGGKGKTIDLTCLQLLRKEKGGRP